MPDLRDDVSRRELERQIADLKRDKMRIEENIRRMEANQQRIFREDTRPKPQGPPESEKLDTPTRRKRSHSGSAKREEDGEGKRGEEAREDDEAKDGAKSEKKRRERDRERDGRPHQSDPRSRNLFGKLLGHLHSAKSRLESEKGSKAAELNQKAHERIEEKLSLSKMNIKEFRKTQFDQQKKEEEAKAQQIDKTIEEMELLLLQRRLESHYSLMMNFIRTKSEPTIFYLPAKHTKDTEHALEETRAAIKHKIASLKVQLQPTTEADEGEEALRASAAAAAVAAAEAPAAPAPAAEAPEEKDAPAAEERAEAQSEDGAASAAEEEKADGARKDEDGKDEEAPGEDKRSKKEDKGAGTEDKKKRITGKQKPESEKKQAPSEDEEEEEPPSSKKDGENGEAADKDAGKKKRKTTAAPAEGDSSRSKKKRKSKPEEESADSDSAR